MDPLTQAIGWNNQGAALIRMGRLAEASSILQQAVDTLKDSVFDCEWHDRVVVDNRIVPQEATTTATAPPSQPQSLSERTTSSDSVGTSMNDGSPSMAGNACLQDEAMSCDDSMYDCQDGAMFIYNRPLMYSTSTSGSTGSVSLPYSHVFRTVSMCIIFNLALAHHLHGRLNGTNGRNKVLCLRAIQLYQIVLTDANSTCCDPCRELCHNINSGGRHLSIALLQCLVLNNLSDLHHELCEYDYGKYCMACLGDIVANTQCFLLCTGSTGNDGGGSVSGGSDTQILNDTEIQAITLNMVLSQFSKAAQAA